MTTEASGGGNPQRSLQLLWDRGERPSRGPKPGLTLDRIVRTAIEVADAEGIGAVSMRRIAAELGVGTMSLYRYLPGKAELLDLMIDAVCVVPAARRKAEAGAGTGAETRAGAEARAEAGAGAEAGTGTGTDGEGAASPGDGWRSVLQDIARATWDQYRSHPWLHNVNQSRPVLGPNALASLEYAMSGLGDLPLTDQQKVTVILMIDSFVTGTARSQEHSARAAEDSGISDEDFWATQSPVLTELMNSGRYPAMARLGRDTFDVSGDEAFAFGLERLLDGVQRFLETTTGGAEDRPAPAGAGEPAGDPPAGDTCTPPASDR